MKADPDYGPTRLPLGDVLMDAGKPIDAGAQLQAAVRLDPALALATRLVAARLGLNRPLAADPNQ